MHAIINMPGSSWIIVSLNLKDTITHLNKLWFAICKSEINKPFLWQQGNIIQRRRRHYHIKAIAHPSGAAEKRNHPFIIPL